LSVFSKFNTLLTNAEPRKNIFDFEIAAYEAIKAVFKKTKIHFYNFNLVSHFTGMFERMDYQEFIEKFKS
jgi:hypothetical protein